MEEISLEMEKKELSDVKKASILQKELKVKYNPKFDKTVLIPEINLVLNKVENKTFMMGFDGLNYSERPFRKVHLTEPYWLGIYPITQAQYSHIMKVNPSHFVGDDRPVEKVSWNEAIEFCKKLTSIERDMGRLPEPYVYRLPTEAEWEFACRANEKDDFYIDIEDFIWYYKNSNEQTHEVGLKSPNSWDFFDMQGNVFEWCVDSCDFRYPEWYNQGFYLTPLCQDDIINPCWQQGSNRIAKGGSWLLDIDQARPHSKYINPPDSRYFVIGFRLALGLPV